MQDFHKLKVWEKAHALTPSVYAVTKSFPKDELFGLTSQMRRCSSSIPSNLAEGCGRSGQAELARFASIAIGISERTRISTVARKGPRTY
jgi:four helix bundle protein